MMSEKVGIAIAGLLVFSSMVACFAGVSDVNAAEYFEPRTATLLQAIRQGDEEKAQMLMVDGDLSLNTQGREGTTPLFRFVREGNIAVIELALQLGADPNYPASVPGDRHGRWLEYPVAAVSGTGNTELLRVLLENGGDPNSLNRRQQPAIFAAITHDNKEHLRLLVESGADLDATDSRGRTAALYATYIGKFEYSYKLLKQGASATVQADNGSTLAWGVHHEIGKRDENADYRLDPYVFEIKNYLIEQGVEFPPLSPREIRIKEGRPNRWDKEAMENESENPSR